LTLKRILGAALLAVAVVAGCVWLNLPGSARLALAGIGLEAHPVVFDFEFTGLGANVATVPVQLFYFPRTPILGITAHYWSALAPLRIDTITRTLAVAVRAGRARWTAPLGLTGLSNYRLRILQVGDGDAPYRLEASETPDVSSAPRNLDLPAISVSDGDYRFDGPAGLWRRPGDAANPYVYSPRYGDLSAPVIWDGLRALHVRVDLAPYPIATFVVPADWEGEGWKNQGFQLSRPSATLTDRTLETTRDVSIPLPFARECSARPQFVVVSGARIPPWSRIAGLWRPLPLRAWAELLRQPPAAGIGVHFRDHAPGAATLDHVAFFDVTPRAKGTFRIFAACPSSHYASTAVTWLDIGVR
jgi:hypothetical protein